MLITLAVWSSEQEARKEPVGSHLMALTSPWNSRDSEILINKKKVKDPSLWPNINKACIIPFCNETSQCHFHLRFCILITKIIRANQLTKGIPDALRKFWLADSLLFCTHISCRQLNMLQMRHCFANQHRELELKQFGDIYFTKMAIWKKKSCNIRRHTKHNLPEWNSNCCFHSAVFMSHTIAVLSTLPLRR